MSDNIEPGAGDARAENAFRAAFERKSQVDPTDHLDGADLRHQAGVRSTSKVALVAAAVLLIVGSIITGVRLTAPAGSVPVAGGATSSDGATSAAEPAEGWRFEFYRDVRVQVPDSWTYAQEPGSDWCAYVPGRLPKMPYVARAEGSSVRLDIGCSRPGSADYRGPPVDTWVDHLALSSAFGGSSGSVTANRTGAFWMVRQVVGHAGIKVVTKDRQLADRILASAEIVQPADPSCDPRSPIQARGFQRPAPAFDVSSLTDVDSILVCQYSFGEPEDAPGLVAQSELTGAAADDELHALQSAPIGGGPNRPGSCMGGYYGESALVIRLQSGETSHDMYLYYATCRGNGFDDGTEIRTLTTAGCTPLIQPPVAIYSGSSASFSMCVPD